MKLKQIPEDFMVKEIPSSKPIGQGEYVWCTLKKRNWDLLKLIKLMSEKLQISRSRIGYAGIKDKTAVTSQSISFFNVPVQKLREIGIDGVELSGFEYNQKPVKLGDLKGNGFSITVRDLEAKYNEQCIKKSVEKIKKLGAMNLFDSQRFGTRNITHLVGKEIMKGDFEAAVFMYLTKTNKDENEETRKARIFLSRTGDYKKAVNLFPKRSKWDLALLNHLITSPGDYAGALRKLPKTLQLMFIHAYQSYLWNSAAIEYNKRHPAANIKIPIVGFGTSIGNSEPDSIIKKILNREKIQARDFKIKGLPELSSFGSSRQLLVFPKGMQYKIEADELNKGRKKVIIGFELPKGSYGTRVVKEIFS